MLESHLSAMGVAFIVQALRLFHGPREKMKYSTKAI